MAVRVHDLQGHSETLAALRLKDEPGPLGWREGHYLPDGTLECRTLQTDPVSSSDAEATFRKRWPTFVAFANWAWQQEGVVVPQALDLSSLTSAEGLVLPDGLQALYVPRQVRKSLNR